ncbi:MAG: carboxypeptidase-like regulatory domain-containing protein [Clostridia bacterium]|nr:carboxypeptidase-like regulatory domain-containing protein [Clostridia bacterium]
MKKTIKRTLFTLLASGMALMSVLFAACTPEEDFGDPATDGYQVTFLYPDGSPVKGTDYAGSGQKAPKTYAVLQDADGNNLTQPAQGILNDYGTVNFNYKVPGEYTVYLGNVPAGFGYETFKTTADRARYTVNLTHKSTNYEINVENPDGSAYANASVKLMNGDNEVASLTTNAQGKATSQTLLAGEYDIIINVPETLGYRPAKTNKNGKPSTVKLFNVFPIDFKDENIMSHEELNDWANDENLNNEFFTRVNTSVDNYLYTAEVKGNEETFFLIKAKWSGVYSITARSDRDADGEIIYDDNNRKVANYNLHFYGDTFDADQERKDMNISGSTNGGNNTRQFSLKKDETFIISVSSLDGQDYSFPFIIAYEREPHTVNVNSDENFTLKFDQINYAVIEFKPTVSGKFQITSSTTAYDPMLICYSSATKKPLPLGKDETNDITDNRFVGYAGNDNGGEGNNFSYVEDVMKNFVGNTFFYYIYIKDVDIDYPAEINVSITRIGDATEETVVTKKTATATANWETQDEQAGKTFHFAPVNGSATVTEKNGGYYITVGETEYELHAAISLELRSIYDGTSSSYKNGTGYSYATIEYMGDGGASPSATDNDGQPTQKNSNLTVYEDLNKRDVMWNYTQFIKDYAEHCNSVGTYKLNAELKLFMERYNNQRGGEIIWYMDIKNANPEYYWLLGCGYYA